MKYYVTEEMACNVRFINEVEADDPEQAMDLHRDGEAKLLGVSVMDSIGDPHSAASLLEPDIFYPEPTGLANLRFRTIANVDWALFTKQREWLERVNYDLRQVNEDHDGVGWSEGILNLLNAIQDAYDPSYQKED